MKRFFAILIFLIVFIGGLFLLTTYDTPRTQNAGATYDVGVDGTTYLFENRYNSMRVYGVSMDGELNFYYETERDSSTGDAIIALDEVNRNLYFLRADANTPESNPYSFEICKINIETREMTRIYEGIPDSTRLMGIISDDEEGLLLYGQKGDMIETFKLGFGGGEIMIASADSRDKVVLPVQYTEKAGLSETVVLGFKDRLKICGDRMVLYLLLCAVMAAFLSFVVFGVFFSSKVAVRLVAFSGLIFLALITASTILIGVIIAPDISKESAVDVEKFVRNSILILDIAMGAFLACYGVFAFAVCKPLWDMERRKRVLAEDRDQKYNGKLPRNEFDRMWVELQRLEIVAEKKRYSYVEMARSFNRFISPTGIKLLDKDDATELEIGDYKVVDGCIGTVILGKNSKEVFNVEQINNAISIILECMRTTSGGLLSASNELSNFELYFERNPKDAVSFGIRLFEKLDASELLSDRLPLVLFDNTRFYFGVVGTGDTAFTGVQCTDLVKLEQYSDSLMETGARMVLTKRMLDLIGEDFQTRYIGYVSDSGSNWSEKLYEVLDTYPEKEKVQRVSLNSKFQEGLQLFYKNNFYLARNAFSQIVRECPTDGIARWYLFTSEKYFNEDNLDKVNYSLFGDR